MVQMKNYPGSKHFPSAKVQLQASLHDGTKAQHCIMGSDAETCRTVHVKDTGV